MLRVDYGLWNYRADLGKLSFIDDNALRDNSRSSRKYNKYVIMFTKHVIDSRVWPDTPVLFERLEHKFQSAASSFCHSCAVTDGSI